MLFEVRDELKESISGLRMEFKADFHGVKSEIHELRSEIHGMKSDIDGVKSELHGVKSELHRVALLVEEQNARNIFVLDGLTGLYGRQDRVESKTDAVEAALLFIRREYERRQAEKQP